MVVQLMANIDPKLRPSAASLTHHSILCPFRRKSRAQLCRELNEEKMKNQLLSRCVHYLSLAVKMCYHRLRCLYVTLTVYISRVFYSTWTNPGIYLAVLFTNRVKRGSFYPVHFYPVGKKRMARYMPGLAGLNWVE